MKDFFGPQIIAGISSKADGPINLVGHIAFDSERLANRAQFLNRKMNIRLADSVMAHVMHGNRCEPVALSNYGLPPIKCDALVTDKKGLALTMNMADCPTIFLYDPINEVIAIIHAGWRPLAEGVIRSTFEAMRIGFNCFASNCMAYVGPGICVDEFEIGPEVAIKFGWEVKGKVFFSLQTEIDRQLREHGVNKMNIQASTDCTFHTEDGERYYSHRRDKSDPLNTQMGVIMMR